MELTVTILAAVMVATTAFYLLQVYKFDLQMMQQKLPQMMRQQAVDWLVWQCLPRIFRDGIRMVLT